MNRYVLICLLMLGAAGCGDPVLHPVTGKVTLGGKPYERLIVYFHPIERKPTEFNVGVGETDKDGNLTLRSTAGGGVERGKYRVTFTCVVPLNRRSNGASGLSDDKTDDDRMLKTKELVPAEYSGESSPVEFEIKAGENFFEYDIPPIPGTS